MNPLTLILNILWTAFVFWLGWKARGKAQAIYARLPRWLRRSRPDAATSEQDGGEKPSGKNGVMDRLSRTGEKLVGKGIESILGKPKGPKDDKEEP